MSRWQTKVKGSVPRSREKEADSEAMSTQVLKGSCRENWSSLIERANKRIVINPGGLGTWRQAVELLFELSFLE